MDLGTCIGLQAMYEQLRQAFKGAGCPGVCWMTNNRILQGCPLSTILVNFLTTIWNWEVDSPRLQVCMAMVVLPSVPADVDSEDERYPVEPLPPAWARGMRPWLVQLR